MNLSELRIDSRRAEDGVWVSGIQGWDDLRIKVRGATSNAYRSALARLQRSLPRSNAGAPLSIEETENLIGEALAAAALLDWQNVTLLGEPVHYSKEKALELLTDPDLVVFREMVAVQVARVGSIRPGDDFDLLNPEV